LNLNETPLLQIEENVSLASHSTFGIGGPARFLIPVSDPKEAQAAIQFAKQQGLPYFVLGKGSNSLFDDRGYPGVVIHNKISSLQQVHETSFTVGAGYSFSLLGIQTARKGFSGLEFASGIPASVGGAVWMNAGANQRETCDSLVSVDFLHADGELETFKVQDLDFSYRNSSFQSIEGLILSATFKLTPSDAARVKQLAILEKRMLTQPLSEKTAGCIFRNPNHKSTGQLIEEAGLKGTSVGGIIVSPIHANFLVNQGEGTAKQVLELVEIIKARVYEHSGVQLQMEVRRVPYE